VRILLAVAVATAVLTAGCAGNSDQATVAPATETITSTVTETVQVPAPSIDEQWEKVLKAAVTYEGGAVEIGRSGQEIHKVLLTGASCDYVHVYIYTDYVSVYYRADGKSKPATTNLPFNGSGEDFTYATDKVDQKVRHIAALDLFNKIMSKLYGPNWAVIS